MKEDGSGSEPVNLTVSFKNMTKEEKLVYHGFSKALTLHVIGQDGLESSTVFKTDNEKFSDTELTWDTEDGDELVPPFSNGVFINNPIKAGAIDTFSPPLLTFSDVSPGTYRIRLKYQYKNVTTKKGKETPLPDNDYWIGIIWSNEITIKILPFKSKEKLKFGKTVNGLALGLSADKYETVMKEDGSGAEPIKINLEFLNKGKRDFNILYHYVFYNDYAEIFISSSKADNVEKSKNNTEVIKQEALSAKQHYPILQQGSSLTRNLSIPGQIGKYWYSFLKPGIYKIKIRYVVPAGGYYPDWTGTVASNEITIMVRSQKDEKLKVQYEKTLKNE